MNEGINQGAEEKILNVAAQEQVKVQFLGGEIDFETFIKHIRDLDQATLDRHAALKNMEVLTDPEVEVAALQGDEDQVLNYYLARSLAAFHVGQIQAIEHGDSEMALQYFQDALTASEYVGFPEDIAYLRATIAFLEGDENGLRAIVEAQACDSNQPVVERLLRALKAGQTSYADAYGGE